MLAQKEIETLGPYSLNREVVSLSPRLVDLLWGLQSHGGVEGDRAIGDKGIQNHAYVASDVAFILNVC